MPFTRSLRLRMSTWKKRTTTTSPFTSGDGIGGFWWRMMMMMMTHSVCSSLLLFYLNSFRDREGERTNQRATHIVSATIPPNPPRTSPAVVMAVVPFGNVLLREL